MNIIQSFQLSSIGDNDSANNSVNKPDICREQLPWWISSIPAEKFNRRRECRWRLKRSNGDSYEYARSLESSNHFAQQPAIACEAGWNQIFNSGLLVGRFASDVVALVKIPPRHCHHSRCQPFIVIRLWYARNYPRASISIEFQSTLKASLLSTTINLEDGEEKINLQNHYARLFHRHGIRWIAMLAAWCMFYRFCVYPVSIFRQHEAAISKTVRRILKIFLVSLTTSQLHNSSWSEK